MGNKRIFNEGENGENKPAVKLSPEEMANRILLVKSNRAVAGKNRDKRLKARTAQHLKRAEYLQKNLDEIVFNDIKSKGGDFKNKATFTTQRKIREDQIAILTNA